MTKRDMEDLLKQLLTLSGEAAHEKRTKTRA